MSIKCLSCLLFLSCGAATAEEITGLTTWYGCMPFGTSKTVRNISLGYGDPRATIGDDLWFTGPGVYDLSGDPNLGSFLALALDGDLENLTIWADGHRVGEIEEWYLFLTGGPVDFAGRSITGAQLNVDYFSPDGDIVARWEFFGAPEPGSLGLLVLATPLAFRRRQARR